MARKKSQANQHRQKIINFTSSDRTSPAHLTIIAHMENHQISPPRPVSSLIRNMNNIMGLTLPSFTNNSRLETPVESYCKRRPALTQEMKDLNIAIQATQTTIKGYNAHGFTEGFLIDPQCQFQINY
ncbi:hypothetical protein TNIN_303831 [Trichonephila inaurata madagascariensis]|uniref:Uncharacterized protein n=1 Tax=Trichonephila inaurata madagascariensis TaxID=2747483 RepID=A0A8X7BUI3_9ARAC|nr:hypothetical protein TNIN_303831 [Trichonephila inaurata madagascariensis]